MNNPSVNRKQNDFNVMSSSLTNLSIVGGSIKNVVASAASGNGTSK